MWYPHEQREKTTRYTGPRPEMPKHSPGLREQMKSYLESRGLGYSTACYNGWYSSKCHGANRIVIPCPTSNGEVYYQARAMGAHPIRYASPKASRDDALVICYPEDTRIHSRFIVVEGPMDALAAATASHNGIAIMGNNPPEVVLKRILVTARTHGYDTVHVVPDMDCFELGAKIASYLGQFGVKTKVIFPEDKDLAAMDKEERKAFLRG